MPQLFKKASIFLILITLGLHFIQPIQAQTRKWDDLPGITGCTTEVGTNGVNIATLKGFECIFANLLRIIMPLASLAAFVMLLVGGFQYLTSAGNPEQTKKAQGIITTAIIGLVTLLGIWFVFRIINTITGLNLLQFEVPN